MPEQQTIVDVEAIRERAAAAIRGPWMWSGNLDSDTVHLVTAHSGMLYLLTPRHAARKYVFNHEWCEGYDLPVADEYVMRWCGCHELELDTPDEHLERERAGEIALVEDANGWDEKFHPTRARRVLAYCDNLLENELYDWWREQEECICGEIREWLRDQERREGINEQGDDFSSWRRTFEKRETDRRTDPSLSVGAQVYTDLYFHNHERGLIESHRGIARFEVLNGRTLAEHHAAAGRINGERRDLYRKDIVGLDNPEATFIAHARQDVDDLLAEIDRLRAELANA